MGNGYGLPKFPFLRRWALAAVLGTAALALSACESVGTTAPHAPFRPASPSTSTPVTGTSGEVGAWVTVSVTIKDSAGYGIPGVVPTITAVNGGGASTGITSGGCNATSSQGATTCRLKSTVAGNYTVKVLTPVRVTGNTITFSQYARSLSFSTQPSCVGGSTTCTSRTDFTTQPAVTVLDAVGTAVVGLAAYNVTYTLTSAGTAKFNAGADSSVVAAASAVTGIATAAGMDVDIAGTYTLTATAVDGVTGANITATSNSFTIVAGAATKLGFTTQPSSSTAVNVAFAQQPVVAIQDVSGNTVTSNTCTANLSFSSGNSAGDVLLGTVAKTAVSGSADFSGMNLRVTTKVGGASYVIKATGSGSVACTALAQGTSDAFAITMAGSPYQLVISQNPSAAALNQVWPSQPVIQVVDYYGNLVSNDNSSIITIAAGAGSPTGTITGSTSIQVVNGVATFNGLKTTGAAAGDAGTYTLDISGVNPNVDLSASIPALVAGQLLGTATSQTITTAGLTPAKVRFSVQPSNGVKNVTVADIVAQVQDANGFLCSGDTGTNVTLTVTAAPPGGGFTAGSTSTVQDLQGVATFSNIAFDTAGVYQLTVSSGALSSAISVAFAIASYGTADHLIFSTQPNAGGMTVPNPWATQPVVQVVDIMGNLVASSNAVVSLVCVNPSNCSLAGTTTVTAVNGVATFSNVRTTTGALNNVAIVASSSGLNAAGSNSFNVP